MPNPKDHQANTGIKSTTSREQQSDSNSRSRLIGILTCIAAIAWCLLYAQQRSGFGQWWKDHGGGVPYVFFWAALLFALWPNPRRLHIHCAIATLGTCGLEFLQLWKPEWLTRFRSTQFGAALLGSGFTWGDLPPYFIGGSVAFASFGFVVFLFRQNQVRGHIDLRHKVRTDSESIEVTKEHSSDCPFV